MAARKDDTLDRNRHTQGPTFGFFILPSSLALGEIIASTSPSPCISTSGICNLQSLHSTVGFERRCKPVYMSGTTEGLPMDVAEDARCQLEQQRDQKKELDRNESVRARLLAISQVEPVGDVVPVDAIKEIKGSPQPSPKGDQEDEFRRKLMSISYTDVPLPAQ